MKKQLVRITENDLHRIISNSVRKIMNEAYRSGMVGNDGNHMVGGRWWHNTDVRMSVTVNGDEIADAVSQMYEDENIVNALFEALGEDMYTITAKFESGADESVGMGEYCDMEEVVDYDGVDTILRNILGEEDCQQALDTIDEMLQNGNFDWQ